MQIKTLKIRNFRSIVKLDLDLDDTTVLIGPNNGGKSAILDAVRIALTRRWGQRGTGFTEYDVHAPAPGVDPRALPAVSIEVVFEEPEKDAWPGDMVAALSEIAALTRDGRNAINLRIHCGWNAETESFEPNWEFLDCDGSPLTGKAKRATNLSGFFGYVPLFWLDALRDADDEFAPRSQYWGRLVRSVQIPKAVESDVKRSLDELDAKLLGSDPKLAKIAEMIGQATHIAINETPGDAQLRMLPLNVWDMLTRAGVVVRNESERPWLPLDHHGQGLQSLSVIFLFQAAVHHILAESDREGAEPIFAIEEPEAHLHPQAARTLWAKISSLPGQKLVTTHSPYFVQHVPLRNLRIVRLSGGRTEVARMARSVVSSLPWTDKVANLAANAGKMLHRDVATGCVAARWWLDEKVAERLANCWRKEPDEQERRAQVEALRYECRAMVSPEEEDELGFTGRRVRGEIFFARRWVLVEGPSEYLLLHAMGEAFGWLLDTNGIAVVDFQNNGNASIYPMLGAAFGIPWRMITDGDAESEKFQDQLRKRGFKQEEIDARCVTLTKPNNLEGQLLADGHEQLLREILVELGQATAATCTVEDLAARLKNEKTGYMARLAKRVSIDQELAQRMPAPFVDLFSWLKEKTP